MLLLFGGANGIEFNLDVAELTSITTSNPVDGIMLLVSMSDDRHRFTINTSSAAAKAITAMTTLAAFIGNHSKWRTRTTYLLLHY